MKGRLAQLVEMVCRRNELIMASYSKLVSKLSLINIPHRIDSDVPSLRDEMRGRAQCRHQIDSLGIRAPALSIT